MSITTRNSLPSGAADLSSNSENTRAGAAAGVEIPVVVHASRYSASTSNVGKALPAVHEETRTVIVFEQGAVVRLTALMVVGEVVVLTNKQTGADVICKVASVKAQPGIQNYVGLEFTQRAPGFWGGSAAPATAVTPNLAAASPVPALPAAEVALPEPPASRPASPTATQPSVLVAPPLPPTLPSVSYEPESVGSSIAEPVEVASIAPTFAAPSGKTFSAGSTLGLGASSAVPSNLRPIEFTAPSTAKSPEGKNLTLIATAAGALLFVGIGGWLFVRPKKQLAPVVQSLPALETAAVPSGGESQLQASSEPPVGSSPADALPPATAAVEPQAASSRSSSLAEPFEIQPAVSRSAIEPASSTTSPAAPKSVAPVSPAQPKPAMDITKMRAPSVNKAIGSVSSEAPPELQAQPATLSDNSLNDNLLTTAGRSGGGLAAPASPVPSRGGQLLQPKLISAPAAVYPSQARAEHVQGDVAVDAFIDETGKVIATKIIAGPAQLQQAAMIAVRTWTYQPARLDGQPISIHTRVTVSFHLQ